MSNTIVALLLFDCCGFCSLPSVPSEGAAAAAGVDGTSPVKSVSPFSDFLPSSYTPPRPFRGRGAPSFRGANSRRYPSGRPAPPVESAPGFGPGQACSGAHITAGPWLNPAGGLSLLSALVRRSERESPWRPSAAPPLAFPAAAHTPGGRCPGLGPGAGLSRHPYVSGGPARIRTGVCAVMSCPSYR